MKSFIYFSIGLILGAAGGAVVAKYICEGKAEQKIADATIEARDYYKEKYESSDEKKELDTLLTPYISDKGSDQYRIFGNSYTVDDEKAYAKPDYTKYENVVTANKDYLYLIDPDEAGMDGNYTQYSLDYYQDGNLVDEAGNIVEDPLNIAGDYLDDLSLDNPEIYVRNDVTKSEYDICYIAACYEQPGGIND